MHPSRRLGLAWVSCSPFLFVFLFVVVPCLDEKKAGMNDERERERPKPLKYFLSLRLHEPFLDTLQSSVLMNKAPLYPLHLTVAVIHVEPDGEELHAYLESIAFQDALETIEHSPSSLLVEKGHLLWTVSQHPCLVFSFESTIKLIESYRAHVKSLLNGYKGWHVSDRPPLYHVTLTTLYHLKKCHKALYRRREQIIDETDLSLPLVLTLEPGVVVSF